MSARTTIVAACALALLPSCGLFRGPADKHSLERAGTYWMEYDATRRGAVVRVDTQGKVTMLAEPSPDVAMAAAQSLLAKLDYGGIPAELEASLAREVVQLGQRTTTVMVLRDSLYRLSELKQNGGLDADTLKLFELVLKAVVDIAHSELVREQAARVAAETARSRRYEELKEMGLEDRELNALFSIPE